MMGLRGPARGRSALVALLSLVVFSAARPAAHAQPAPNNRMAPPSAALARTMKLYHSRDYWSASIELKKVLDRRPLAVAERERAEFFMAKTLFGLKLYIGTLSYLDLIVHKGKAHRFHAPALNWLVALTRVLPESSGVVDKIGKYDASALAQPAVKAVRDELAYLMGRYSYSRGKFPEAIKLFKSVSNTSPFFFKAKFFEGITHVRRSEARPALAAFKQILTVTRKRPSQFSMAAIERFEALATLQMARLFYSTAQFELALRYYAMVPRTSPDWPDALSEASWAHLMKRQTSRALAKIHMLNAPFLNREFVPESTILEAVLYFRNCLYSRSVKAVSQFNARYRTLRKAIKGFVDKTEDNSDFFAIVKRVQAKKPGQSTKVERFVAKALKHPYVRGSFDWVREIDRELRIVGNADKAWQATAVASEVLQELTLHKSLASADAGKMARERLRREWRDLRLHARDGLKVRYVVNERRTGKTVAKPVAAAPNPKVVVAGDHAMWNFNKGFGKGPQGDYRFGIRSKCPVRAKKGPARPSAKSKPTPAKPKIKVYDFSNDVIYGDLIRPDGMSSPRRIWLYPTTLIHIRRDFIAPMLMSAARL